MDSKVAAFAIFWLSAVSIMGLASLMTGIYELRRGSARSGWMMGAKYEREEEPFYFWMSVLGRFAVFFVACFMFWFGLDMLTW